MNDPSLSDEVLKAARIQAPVILVSALGLLVAVRFRRKAPGASRWTAAAFALALFVCGLLVVTTAAWYMGWRARFNFAWDVLVPVLRAVAYVLLLIGVYAGRVNPATTPAGSPQSLWQPVVESLRARPGLKNIFFTIFALVFLLVFLVNTLVTFVAPESFLSTARIRLGPDATGVAGSNAPPSTSAIPDARMVQTECEILRSEVVLGRVIENLNLNTEWGKKYAGGDRLKTTETIGLLKSRIDVRPVRDTSIFEIRIYGEDPVEAARLANTLADAYQNHRLQDRRRWTITAIDALKRQLDERYTQVREAEIAFERVRQQLNVPRDEAQWTNSSADPERLRPYFEAKRNLQDLESQRQSLFLRLQSEATDLNLPKPSLAEIVDRAVPAMKPVRPDKSLSILLGLWSGLWIAFAAGAGVTWLSYKVGKPQAPG